MDSPCLELSLQLLDWGVQRVRPLANVEVDIKPVSGHVQKQTVKVAGQGTVDIAFFYSDVKITENIEESRVSIQAAYAYIYNQNLTLGRRILSVKF